MNGNASVYGLEGFGIHLSGRTTRPLFFNINEFWTTMTFDDCKTGIYAFKHALNIENTSMTNVDVGIDVAQCQTKDVVLDGNTITARRYGIRSFLNEPVHPISAIKNNEIVVTDLGTGTSPVTGIGMEEGAFSTTIGGGWAVNGNDVTMQRGGYGISYRNGMTGVLESNTVNNSGSGILSVGPYKGVRVEGASFTRVDFNDVTQSTSVSSNAGSEGIYSSAGWANTFTCNCVDNTGVGLQFLDMADFTNNVRGNKLNNHDGTGIQLGALSIGNARIGTQYHTGNEWVVPPSGFGAINYSGLNVVAQSKFWVDPNEKNGALSPDVDPEEWFEEDPTEPPSFDCSNSCSAPTTPPPFEAESDTPTFLDEAIATEKLYPDVFEDETNWKGAYRLYRKILRHPAIGAYSTEFEDFVDVHENLSVGKLAYIAEEKTALFNLSATEDSVLETRRATWRNRMDGLRTLDSLLQSGTSVSQSQYGDAVQDSKDALDEYEQYLDGLTQTRQAKIQTLLTQNAAVSVSLTPAVNHKAVNDIVLKFLQSDTLATGNLATLESIAAQCPLEDGDAVYEARAFVTYLTGADFDDLDLCISSQPRQQQTRRKQPNLEKDITLYPNPTSGEVFLSISGEVLARVFDNVGQLRMEKTVSDSRLNLSELQPGAYRIQLFHDGQMLTTRSVILLNR